MRRRSPRGESKFRGDRFHPLPERFDFGRARAPRQLTVVPDMSIAHRVGILRRLTAAPAHKYVLLDGLRPQNLATLPRARS